MKFFLYIFAIHLSSRHEKRCQMCEILFCLFHGSKNQGWVDTLSFQVLLCQKIQEVFDFTLQSKISKQPFMFFWHNKTQKERISTKSKNYLIRPCLKKTWITFLNVLSIKQRSIYLCRCTEIALYRLDFQCCRLKHLLNIKYILAKGM